MDRNTALFSCLLAIIALLVILPAPVNASSFSLSYCSSQNTGSGSEKKYHIWQSNGWCHDQCVEEYAFAVVMDKDCWCSDYTPAEQQDTGDCSEDCPGFPDEKCGNKDKNLFAYIALDKKPSGTQGASTPTPTVSEKQSPSKSPSFSPTPKPSPSSQGASTLRSTTQEPATVSTFSFLNTRASTDSPVLSRSPFLPVSSYQSTSTYLVLRSTSLTVLSSWITFSTFLTLSILRPSASPSPISSAKETHQDPTTVVETVLVSVVSDKPSAPAKTSASPTPTTMKTSASSATPSQTFVPTPITSVQTLTVSGVIVTQTVTGMSTPPPAMTRKKGKKKNVGAIVGGVVGGVVALIAIVVGVIFFLRRRRRQQDGVDGDSSNIQRNTSTLSRTGLLKEKQQPPEIITSMKRGSRHMDSDSITPVSMSDRRNSRPMIYDQRLNPSAIMDMDNASRSSLVTMEDNRDYTRTLNIRNPDPDPQ
ncbi:hypothetical protein K469DRAFT_114795 [Zopfia rhizophila CBS 207.26]|uniref:WSC domain-containing protein n=1 Tax=Zopfia rhizophila CBS 207.26 TaxID=1314779 RepID=A0A6A6E8Q7_9PEZI|nr:hypothetical protein K469DRAFT_114795 [Zopfia rhizophila CBS 207.26]